MVNKLQSAIWEVQGKDLQAMPERIGRIGHGVKWVKSGRSDERDMSTCAIFIDKVLPTPKDFHQIFSHKTFHQKLTTKNLLPNLFHQKSPQKFHPKSSTKTFPPKMSSKNLPTTKMTDLHSLLVLVFTFPSCLPSIYSWGRGISFKLLRTTFCENWMNGGKSSAQFSRHFPFWRGGGAGILDLGMESLDDCEGSKNNKN